MDELQFPIILNDQQDYNEFMAGKLEAIINIINVARCQRMSIYKKLENEGFVRKTTIDHYREGMFDYANTLNETFKGLIKDIESDSEINNEDF